LEKEFMNPSLKQCLALLLAFLVHPAPALEGAEPPGGALLLEGQSVGELVLTDRQGRQPVISRTGPRVSLPPGEYRVQQVTIQGGYTGRAAPGETGWFLVTSDQPHRLRVGAPLTPQVTGTRRGTVLSLDYELRDDGGLRYTPPANTPPPRFTIRQHGREVGSGSFEYG
jgi:hypothetical protein